MQNVEPWMSGNARGPSSAFCLMHRLFTLKISNREVKALLDHKDSPYIRAVRSGAILMQPCLPWVCRSVRRPGPGWP